MDRRVLLSPGRQEWSTWPRYDAAVLGFRNYWYPVMWSAELRNRPLSLTLLGEQILFLRDRGKAYALQDRCPHRSVPLRLGSQEFPGTWSCGYHGWTYDLASGTLVAVITDGPDSPICGRVGVRTFPLAERFGLVWIYIGDLDPPPLEADLPEEILDQELLVCGRIHVRPGNWRLAAENGFDEGHAKYLHRNALWTLGRRLPVWNRTHVEPDASGRWITRVQDEVHFDTEFPGLGTWPRPRPWKRAAQCIWARLTRRPKARVGATVSLRLPGFLRVTYPSWTHYEWYVPVDADQHRYVQLAVKPTSGLDAIAFRLWYWAWVRRIFHGQFNGQDGQMVETMEAPPERLYRPDVSIIAWRKLCELPRGVGGTMDEVRDSEVGELAGTPAL